MEKRFEAIGKKIRKRRKEMGFKTQADLAAAVGTDRTRVSRWESGEELPEAYKAKLLEVLKASESLFAVDSPSANTAPDILQAVERAVSQVLAKHQGAPASQAGAAASEVDDEAKQAAEIVRRLQSVFSKEGLQLLLSVSTESKAAWLLSQLDPKFEHPVLRRHHSSAVKVEHPLSRKKPSSR